ncbi:protein-(glutamine-N5) methyltransferase, release factor-specific [Candidatus Saccharibacteria bacterium 32-49-12]|nr:MAG: protein-(glutamine-N5) methyltransferase, release factor-specific [Candidatus Saccharibacteria bacterium 32-49-12]
MLLTPPVACGITNNMNISAWLKDATKQLKDIGIDSARLDAELILSETLRKPRTYLHAHLDETIDPRRIDIAYARLDLRKDRVPLAYIVGYKEFYGRKFSVSPNVLIPRPESEDMIDLLLEVTASDISDQRTLIDVGTGSGCLGITAKLERPGINVVLSDISPQALDVAQANAHSLGANITTQEQDLLFGQIEPVDYILANLPYVDESWSVSPELRHEPKKALFAKNGGLAMIFRLIEQAPLCLNDDGWLFIEADPEQHSQIITFASNYGFIYQKTRHYCVLLRRRVGAES